MDYRVIIIRFESICSQVGKGDTKNRSKMRDLYYREKRNNYLNYILSLPLVFRREFQLFKKVSFEANLVAKYLHLLKQRKN